MKNSFPHYPVMMMLVAMMILQTLVRMAYKPRQNKPEKEMQKLKSEPNGPEKLKKSMALTIHSCDSTRTSSFSTRLDDAIEKWFLQIERARICR